jgi:hypothetical protein
MIWFSRTNRELVRLNLIGGTPMADCCGWLGVRFTLYLAADAVATGSWDAAVVTDAIWPVVTDLWWWWWMTEAPGEKPEILGCNSHILLLTLVQNFIFQYMHIFSKYHTQNCFQNFCFQNLSTSHLRMFFLAPLAFAETSILVIQIVFIFKSYD